MTAGPPVVVLGAGMAQHTRCSAPYTYTRHDGSRWLTSAAGVAPGAVLAAALR